MSNYFSNFPQTTYAVANSSFVLSEVVRDFTLRTAIKDKLTEKDPYVFLPYIVKEGERAEDIADFYYGSTDFIWLVYFSNDIVDPYSQWPKSHPDFLSHIKKKFADIAGDTDPVEWSLNTGITTNIVHYLNDDSTTLITPESFTHKATFDPDFVSGAWTAVRQYENEFNLNEKLREIRLIDENYASLAESDLRELLSDV